jgi:hypothetical protein
MYLLDTNVVSELGRPNKAHPNVARWARRTASADFYMSVVSVTELELGVLLMERRDQRQGAVLRRWLEGVVLPSFAGRIVEVDERIARLCARLHVPDPRPANDAFIAATAIVHDLTVVTRNTVDFAPTGVPLINPWDDLT